ncbi:hypothetical protein M378DRAFT_166327 [Amanita muscaria Koide BX008]|uniref:Uncharacterized protein n=1 Tax=Amanita muscaria (strain Koide BX008) TaxID=946122 RepID=A0A0C2WZJ9_AMAMK|nr:hypothetical protein M378DRAFT_166327 [Amanita muscaria Koide BX008]
MSQAHSVFCVASFYPISAGSLFLETELSYENAGGFLKVFSPIYISSTHPTKSGIQSNTVHEDLRRTLFESHLGWKSYIKHLVRDVGNVLRV